ncbi:hypothetical protein ACFPRL_22885 [Pseudoclavibacter helvolus]
MPTRLPDHVGSPSVWFRTKVSEPANTVRRQTMAFRLREAPAVGVLIV